MGEAKWWGEGQEKEKNVQVVHTHIKYCCIALLLQICGPWFWFCLEFIGRCQNLLLNYLHAGKVGLVVIGMVAFG